jgi:Flp pilus assembly protein protease CpaA
LIAPELLTIAVTGGALAAGAMAVQLTRRYRALGPAPSAIPALAAAAQAKVPYGIAIAAGALFVGFKLLAS